MSSIYGRLGFNFNTSNFHGDDQLTTGAQNYLKNSNIRLNQWQINDIATNSVNGYYQNPYTSQLNALTIVLNNFIANCNTSVVTFTNAPDVANSVVTYASAAISSIGSFITHTNNLSGVTNSSNTAQYPDLNSGLAIGRQVLTLTAQADGVQNNTPVLGNFTSLYIANDVTQISTTVTNDYNILSASFYISGGNTATDISNTQLSLIASDIQSISTLLDGRRNADVSFYQNSLAVVSDYAKISTFSNVGATQNSILNIVGTNKLLTDLASSPPVPFTTNAASVSATSILTGSTGSTASSGTGGINLTPTGVGPGTYGSATQTPILTINQYGQITQATTINTSGGATQQSIIEFDTTTSGQQIVDTFDATQYRSAKYEVQITSGVFYHVIELRIVHNGINTFLAQYGEIYTNSILGTFSAAVSSGTVNLSFNPTNAVNAVKMVRTLITA